LENDFKVVMTIKANKILKTIFHCVSLLKQYLFFFLIRANVLSSSFGWELCLYDRRVSGAMSIPIKKDALGQGQHSGNWAGGRMVQ
jgi:hypothetical protein